MIDLWSRSQKIDLHAYLLVPATGVQVSACVRIDGRKRALCPAPTPPPSHGSTRTLLELKKNRCHAVTAITTSVNTRLLGAIMNHAVC